MRNDDPAGQPPGHPESGPLELWGGLECSVVQVGDTFRDQFADTGHRWRLGDLDQVAALGIRHLRYPVVWESVAPDDPDHCDWRWHDRHLGHLRRLGIHPIAGLVHHGSGPRYTSLLDPAFPELLARHAGRVAERYPWIESFTPVNEPLTTARFSALYGHWFPHQADYGAFLRALVVQCRAVQLSMRAIRRVTPQAQLVQTEDMGRTFSRPGLAYQARHDNERRWLSFDLLLGRIDAGHPWRRILMDHGVPAADLDALAEGDAAPDVIGINHYATSDRYLDERLHLYPPCSHGGNGREPYADVEAVRVDLPAGQTGPAARLQETWARYGRPVAVTEAHLGCTREEQLRWLKEVWDAASGLREEGADIRAVTVWSLFGAVDWCSLLRRREGRYEPGAFDVRALEPRRTAIGHAAEALARTGDFTHPVLDRPGWWRREGRHFHPPKVNLAKFGRAMTKNAKRGDGPGPARPILVTGGTGTLGRAFARICGVRGLDHVLLRRAEMDITDAGSTALALDRLQPWAVINTAGYVRVADAEREPEVCFRENARGAGQLAEACAARGLPLVTFSSDLVFDGRLGRRYVEDDPVSPASVYGESKAEAERLVAGAHPDALVIRTSAFFGPWDPHNFAYHVLRGLAEGRPVEPGPGVVSPTYVPDLVHASLDLLLDGETGLWHLANDGMVSWRTFAARVAQAAGLVLPELPAAEEGPVTALASRRAWVMPSLENAVDRFVHETELPWQPQTRLAAAE